MIGLNRPKGINIKNNIELNYLRQSGKMLNSVKKTIKKNIEEGITTKELDYIAEKEILNLGGNQVLRDFTVSREPYAHLLMKK